jgi:aminomethyltransferase
VGEGDFLVIPNASNTAPALAALEEAAAAGDAEVEDVTATRAMLAVQGPRAREVLTKVVPEAAAVPRFGVDRLSWPPTGTEVLVGGTGYTGEEGVELFVPAVAAASVWQALLAAGASPAGLAARDTLRLEMGYPLHGHELGPGITPLQAGLGWVVGWDKPTFRGREALAAEKERGPARRLRGVVLEGRQIPRAGHPVLVEGREVGEVTSGNLSPTLSRGIALAFLAPEVSEEDAVEVGIRGKTVPGRVVRPPFVRK